VTLNVKEMDRDVLADLYLDESDGVGASTDGFGSRGRWVVGGRGEWGKNDDIGRVAIVMGDGGIRSVLRMEVREEVVSGRWRKGDEERELKLTRAASLSVSSSYEESDRGARCRRRRKGLLRYSRRSQDYVKSEESSN